MNNFKLHSSVLFLKDRRVQKKRSLKGRAMEAEASCREGGSKAGLSRKKEISQSEGRDGEQVELHKANQECMDECCKCRWNEGQILKA